MIKPIKHFLYFFPIYIKENSSEVRIGKIYSRAQNLSEEEKKKLKYDRKWYRNLTEDEKQRLAEYRKNYSKIQKIKTDSFIDSAKSLHEIKKLLNFLFLSRNIFPFIALEEHY